MSEFGARLRRLRAERGLSQRALAESQYTAAYVSSVESGRRTPSGDAVRHFAERLGLDPEELLSGRSPHQVVQLDLDLVAAAWSFLCGSPDSAANRLRRIARDAEHLGQPRQAGLARLWLSRCAPEVEEHLLAAEEMLTTPPDRALAVTARAAVSLASDEPHYAMYLLQNCHDDLMASGHRDPLALLGLRALLADVHLRLGNTGRAGEYAESALRLSRLGRESDVGELIDHCTRLCIALLTEDRFTEAAVAVAQAHDLVHEVALRPALARCLLARGRSRKRSGAPEAAMADLRAARERATDPAPITLELAEISRELGRLDEAESLLASIPGPPDAPVRYELGALALARADRPLAETHLREAIDLATRTGATGTLARSLDLLADLLTADDRLPEAADLLRTGLRTLGATPTRE